MPFIRQNGDDSRPKNAATCPAFLAEICAKFGRTMNRHILLSLQKQLSVVSIIFGPSKKNKPYWPSTFAQKSDAKRLRWKIKTATIFQNCLFESQQPKQSIDCFVTKMSFVFQHTSIRQPNRYVCTTWRFSKYETWKQACTSWPSDRKRVATIGIKKNGWQEVIGPKKRSFLTSTWTLTFCVTNDMKKVAKNHVQNAR